MDLNMLLLLDFHIYSFLRQIFHLEWALNQFKPVLCNTAVTCFLFQNNPKILDPS